jgi:hypothetical protein
VSGTHYFRNPPKIDYRITIIVLLGLFSILLHVLQYQRWEYAVKALSRASICNTSVRNGGTKEAQEIYRRATEQYDAKVAKLSKTELAAATEAAAEANKKNKLSAAHMTDEEGKPLGHIKMQRDPLFLSIIDDIVANVQFEGALRPEWKDALIVHFFKSPVYVYNWFTSKKVEAAVNDSSAPAVTKTVVDLKSSSSKKRE